MRRRDVIGVLAGAIKWPLAVRGQQYKIPHVGILTPASSVDAPMMRVVRGRLS
jgi:hypothetical protein